MSYNISIEHKRYIEEVVLEHPAMNSDLLDPSNGVTALKHIRQQVYIVFSFIFLICNCTSACICIKAIFLIHRTCTVRTCALYEGVHPFVQASILGHLERLRLLQPHTCFIEFGAGRGTYTCIYLSSYRLDLPVVTIQ